LQNAGDTAVSEIMNIALYLWHW